jgi:CRISPR-associated protein Cmr6
LGQAHLGLVFDKLIDTWRINTDGGCDIQAPAKKQTDRDKLTYGSKRAWLEEAIERYCAIKNALESNLTKALERESKLIEALGGQCVVMKTDWRLVSGLGNGHPFETGFIWHRTLGVPYLPGSSVKGLIRAWADPHPNQDGNPLGWGDPEEWNDVKHLFGDTIDDGAGSLIVFDALPLVPPAIELDIMNPHYGDYYADKPDRNGHPIPPADYLRPNPIFFLTVAAGQSFRFALAPRPDKRRDEAGQADDVKYGLALLKTALSSIGAGGKTAVGYGYMTLDDEYLDKEEARRAAEERQRLEQVKRDEYVRMSQNQKRIKDLNDLAADPAAGLMDDKKNKLRNMANTLLKEAAGWRDPADRSAAADTLKRAYEVVGWRNAEKRQQRERAVAALYASLPAE